MKKKILLLFAVAICIIGCGKQKAELEALLTEQMSNDQDQKDYNLPPEEMASCVLSEIDKGIPGFLFGPKRDGYYQAYNRYLKSKGSEDVFAVFKESVEVFGSEKLARERLLGLTDHVVTCMGAVLASKG